MKSLSFNSCLATNPLISLQEMVYAGMQTINLFLYVEDKKFPIFDEGEQRMNMLRLEDAPRMNMLRHVQIAVRLLISHSPFPAAMERLPLLGQLGSSNVSVFNLLGAREEIGETTIIHGRQDPYVESRSCGDEAARRSHKYGSIPFQAIPLLLKSNISNMERRLNLGKMELQIFHGSPLNITTWYSKINMRAMLPPLVMALLAVHSIVNPPGGKWHDDTPFHKAGDAMIASTRPNLYGYLVLINMVAFSSSLLAILLNATGWPSRNIRLRWIAKCAMGVSLIAIAVSYVGSTMAIAPITQIKSVNHVVLIGVMLVSIGITLAISAFHPLILLEHPQCQRAG
ncbi:uncharacterized protein LOC125187032 [Salvia hispanica]|uniref:uncharacterized protein LOC125187032 n=1 Tax=Salvia hispanica TaxID=49212 RepID=UPI0020098B1C|nr:uncharacterized protein LOC125187032 [Salvia hispanica]